MSLKKTSKSRSENKTNIDGNHIHFVMKFGIKIIPVSEFTYLQRKGVTDYSVIKYQRWYIEVYNNGKLTFFNKIISSDDLNEAIAKTIKFYYNKLKEKENEKTQL